jgi:hypothetical protein
MQHIDCHELLGIAPLQESTRTFTNRMCRRKRNTSVPAAIAERLIQAQTVSTSVLFVFGRMMAMETTIWMSVRLGTMK